MEMKIVVITVLVNIRLLLVTSSQNQSKSSISAIWDNKYKSITVRFTDDLKLTNQVNGKCADFLEEESLRNLGSNPICNIQNLREIQIIPGLDGLINMTPLRIISNLSNGKWLSERVFRPNVPWSRSMSLLSWTTCSSKSQALLIRNPMESGFRPFRNYSWLLIRSNGTAEHSNQTLLKFNTKFPILHNVNTKVKGYTDKTNNLLVKARDSMNYVISGMKSVDLKNGDLSILSNGDKSITSDEDLFFEVDTATLFCSSNISDISYIWNITDMTTMSQVRMDSSKIRERSLAIKGTILHPGKTYTISLSVTYKNGDQRMVTKTSNTSVHVQTGKLRAILAGGDRSVNVGSTLILDGSKSYIPNGIGKAMYSWTCDDPTTGRKCQNTSKNNTKLSLPNSPTLNLIISDDVFTTEKRYMFQLTLSRGNQSSTDSVTITIENKRVLPTLIDIRSKASGYTSSAVISIDGIVDLSSAWAEYEWSVLTVYDTNAVDMSQGNFALSPKLGRLQYRTKQIRYFPVTFVINKGSLQSGLTYKFVLNAKYHNATGKASVLFKMPIPPRYGYLQINRENGTKFGNKFQLVTLSWIDFSGSERHLLHRFGFYNPMTGRNQYLSSWSLSPYLDDVYLPTGNRNESIMVTVFATVMDSNGETSSCSKNVTVPSTLGMLGDTKLSPLNNVTMQENSLAKNAREMYRLLTIELRQRVQKRRFMAAMQILQQTVNLHQVDQSLDITTSIDQTTSALLKSSLSVDEYIIALDGLNSILMNVKDNDSLRMKFLNIISDITSKIFKEVVASPGRPQWLSMNAGIIARLLNNILKGKNLQLKKALTVLKTLRELSCFTTEMDIPPYMLMYQYFTIQALWVNPLKLSSAVTLQGHHFSQELLNRFLHWNCTSRKKCSGFCAGQIILEKNRFFNMTKTSSRIITNIVDVGIFNPQNGKMIGSLSGLQSFTVALKIDEGRGAMSNVKCKTYSEHRNRWEESGCMNASVVSSLGGSKKLLCTCNRFGLLAGFYDDQKTSTPFTTTSTTTMAMNVQVSTLMPTDGHPVKWNNSELIEIRFNRDCNVFLGTPEKKKVFLNTAAKSIAKALNVSQSRIHAVNASCGSIILKIGITERQNLGEPSKAELISNLTRIVSMGKLDIEMPDGKILRPVVEATTILPTTTRMKQTMPPSTPPFIPELTTNWVPMALGLLAALAFLSLIVCYGFVKHTRYLKQKKFTEINSDIKDKKEKKEDIAALGKSQRIKELVVIMENELDAHSKSPNPQSRSIFPRRGRNKIKPLNDANAFYLPDVRRGATPNFLDIPRLALDESSSDEDDEQKQRYDTLASNSYAVQGGSETALVQN